MRLLDSGYLKATVHNNLGVLYGRFGASTLQIEEYEETLSTGSVLAGINIVHHLINAGFLRRAEQLLETLGPDPDSETNRADAVAKLAKAKAKAEVMEKRTELRVQTTPVFDTYQQQITKIVAFWVSGETFVDGQYVASDPIITLRLQSRNRDF